MKRIISTARFGTSAISPFVNSVLANIETFDGTGWDVSSTSNYRHAFRKANKLKAVDIHNWTMSTNGSYYENMFDGTTSLTRLDLGPKTYLPGGTSSSSWYITSDNWDYYNNGNQYGLYTSGTVQSWTIRRTALTQLRFSSAMFRNR